MSSQAPAAKAAAATAHPSLPPRVPFSSHHNSNHSKSGSSSLTGSNRSIHKQISPQPPATLRGHGHPTTSIGSSNVSLTSLASDTSREGLRREVLKRRNSMTYSEFNFLQDIVASGTEVEVQLVRQKLMDPSLCFDVNEGEEDDSFSNDYHPHPQGKTTGEGNDNISRENSVGQQGGSNQQSLEQLQQQQQQEQPPLMIVQLAPTESQDYGELDGSIDTCASGQGKPPSTPMPMSPRRDFASMPMPSPEELYPDSHNHNYQHAARQFRNNMNHHNTTPPHLSDLEQTPLVQNLRVPKSLDGAAQLPLFHQPGNTGNTPTPVITNRAPQAALRPVVMRRRVSNPLVDQLWKAHEQGLAVTSQQSSKRLQHRREQSMSALSPMRRFSSMGGASVSSRRGSSSHHHPLQQQQHKGSIGGGSTITSHSAASGSSSHHDRSLLSPQELIRIKQRHFRTHSHAYLAAASANKDHRSFYESKEAMMQVLQNISTDSSNSNMAADISSLLLPTDEEIFRRSQQQAQQQQQPPPPPPPRPFGAPTNTSKTNDQLNPDDVGGRAATTGGVGPDKPVLNRRPSILRRMTSDGASRNKSVTFQPGHDEVQMPLDNAEPLPVLHRRSSLPTILPKQETKDATIVPLFPSASTLPPTAEPETAESNFMEDSLSTFASEYRPAEEIMRKPTASTSPSNQQQEQQVSSPTSLGTIDSSSHHSWGRRDSTVSVASLNLHRAHPIRSNSIASTTAAESSINIAWDPIKSFQEQMALGATMTPPAADDDDYMPSLNLHPARPIRQDSIASTTEGKQAAQAFQDEVVMRALGSGGVSPPPPSWGRRDSMNSVASLNLHHAHPIRQPDDNSLRFSTVDGVEVMEAFKKEIAETQWSRRDSLNSLASLNLHTSATSPPPPPIQESIFTRQVSMGSIGMLGDTGEVNEAFRPEGWARRDSMNSLASLNLHLAHPIRQDSVYSRRDSMNSYASLNLHRAHPIRQDSIYSANAGADDTDAVAAFREKISAESSWGRRDSMSSIASLNLHIAHPLRSSSIYSTGDGLDATEAFKKEFSVAPNTAMRPSWGRRDSMESLASLNIHKAHPIASESAILEILRCQGSAIPDSELLGESLRSLPAAQPLQDESIRSTATGREAKEALKREFQGDSVRDASSGTMLSSLSEIPTLQQKQLLEESSLRSIPSLHPAQPIRQDSIASTATGLQAKQDMLKQFSSASIVASEWEGVVNPDEWEDKKCENQDFAFQPPEPSSVVLPGPNRPRPVFMRKASASEYDEEGMEVAAVDELVDGLGGDDDDDRLPPPPTMKLKTQILVPKSTEPSDDGKSEDERSPINGDIAATKNRQGGYRHFPNSLVSFGADSVRSGTSRKPSSTSTTIDVSMSFDESKSIDRFRGVFRGELPYSISEDELSNLLAPHCKPKLKRGQSDATVFPADLNSESWELNSIVGDYDAWDAIRDPYINGYGGGGSLPFLILGTSVHDVDAQPHVLSPPLMESLQSFFPTVKTNDNFFLKYSLVRDGASMHTLMQHARGAKYSILALENTDGEVFGAFTTEPWRKTWSYFGGAESFLWRMRKSRKTQCHSIIDQAQMESEIDVFPFTGANQCIQLCTHNKIAVGGGSPEHEADEDKRDDNDDRHNSINLDEAEDKIKDHEWGYGLALQADLQHASSSPCLTFGSPSLSSTHSDGSLFEIINLELWTLTPCSNVVDAEKLELGKLFLERASFNYDEVFE